MIDLRNRARQWGSHLNAFRSDIALRLRARRARIVASDPVYLSFRQPGRAEAGATAAAALLIAALVALGLMFDWNMLRGPIGRWASSTYDRDIQLNGDLDVRLFSWTPAVRVKGLRIGGPDWAADRDTFRVDDLLVTVRLRSLIRGQLDIDRLEFQRPQAVLLIDEAGRRSWDLASDKPSDAPLQLPPISHLVIRDGRLVLEEESRGLALDAIVTAREGSGERAGFHLDGTGQMNNTPLKLMVRGGPFINIRRDRPYGFSAELSGVRTTLKAQGRIIRPFDLGRFDATLSLEGRNLADVYLLTGIATPNTPAYRLSGRLARNGQRFTFSCFKGKVGASDLSGDLSVDKVGDRRRVEADLRSSLLDLDDLAVVLGAQARTTGTDTTVVAGGSGGRLLPDASLNVDRLRAMDGRLSFRAGRVRRNALDVRQVSVDAGLEAGILTLEPVSFTFDRGELRGTARINGSRDVPYSAIDFRLRNYPLESIIPARNGTQTVAGRALGRVKLEGSGASIHDFAAGSKGSLSLVVPKGTMRSAFAELLGINASAGLTRLLGGDKSTTEIRCAVADFSVSNGIATARTFVIDTSPVLAQGRGTISLRNETLDLKIDGETKDARLIRLWSPITVQGPLSAPRVGVESGRITGQLGLAAGLAALINPLAALLPLIDPGLAEDADCAALIASAR